MQEYRITLLGPTGVGKTSLLTSMYYLFEHANLGIEKALQLTPELESSAIINRQLEKLKTLQDNFEATGGITGTAESRDFIFELGRVAKKPELRLIFRDYPGGYLSQIDKLNQVLEYIKTSEVIIVAMDAAALMEKESGISFNDHVNKPETIYDFFKNAFKEGLSGPKLILLVPVKCETYLQDEPENRSEALRKSVEEKYKASLNYFQTEPLRSQLAVVVTPVQTVGNVFFSHIEIEQNGQPHFKFAKKTRNALYNPKDVEQPLRYLLRFLLKQHLEARSWWHRFNNALFRFDQDFEDAIRVLSSGRKERGNGFYLLQGYDLLT